MSFSAMSNTAGGFIAVGLGAVLGAWARWGLSLLLNQTVPNLPLGTLVANLVGGYMIGIAVALFGQMPGLAPEWRLFAVTGFLGALTTFSTFSAEITDLLLRGEYLTGGSLAAAHLAGSIVLTVAGIASFRALAA